jgi:hypothetical protein
VLRKKKRNDVKAVKKEKQVKAQKGSQNSFRR